jgi:hypothetical protein
MQALVCPLCALYAPGAYHVNKNTNLYKHITSTHLYNPNDPALAYIPTAPAPPPETKPPEKTVDFVEETLLKDLTDECSICMESLSQGRSVYTVNSSGSPHTISQQLEIHYCSNGYSMLTKVGQRIARLVCLCVFHMDCIQQWFAKSKRCPLHEQSDEKAL